MNPFDFVNAINTSKKDLIRESDSSTLMEKQYSPFLVNRALSYFIDTILYANEINQANHVDSLLQNDYYLNSVRSGKRFSKWAKPVENFDIESIQEYYKVSYMKALDINKILSKEQIDLIKTKIIKGGNHVQPRPTSGSET
jgi:hypothetical protein